MYAVCWQCQYAFEIRRRKVAKRQCPRCYSTQLAYVPHHKDLYDLGLRKGKELREEDFSDPTP